VTIPLEHLQFLSVDDVLRLHVDQIARFGGADGVRDLAALESAVATPSTTFDGVFLHADVFSLLTKTARVRSDKARINRKKHRVEFGESTRAEARHYEKAA